MRISDWSSDVCSSDLYPLVRNSENGFVADMPLEYGFWLLLALVLAHAGAAFRHHIFQGDDTLRHMLPVPRRADPPVLRRVDQGEIGRASCRDRVCQDV